MRKMPYVPLPLRAAGVFLASTVTGDAVVADPCFISARREAQQRSWEARLNSGRCLLLELHLNQMGWQSAQTSGPVVTSKQGTVRLLTLDLRCLSRVATFPLVSTAPNRRKFVSLLMLPSGNNN